MIAPRYVAARLARAGLVASASAVTARGQAQLPPPLELRVPKAPTVAHGVDGAFLAYELHVTNFGAQPLTLRAVEVISTDPAHRVLYSVTDSTLLQGIARPGFTGAAAERSNANDAGGEAGMATTGSGCWSSAAFKMSLMRR